MICFPSVPADIYSAQSDRASGIVADQTVALNGYLSQRDYPSHMRRIRFHDSATGNALTFLTNQFTLPATTICALYKRRWQVELFFKWIKQHLRIKAFYGTSENAVKTQIWIAVSVYLLVAIVKKRLDLPARSTLCCRHSQLLCSRKCPFHRLFSRRTTQIHS